MRSDRCVHNRLSSLSRLLLLGGLTLLCSGCGPVAWEHDYQTGLAKASQTRRRALVQVQTAMNPDCRAMDDVFSDAEVQRLLQDFVPIKLDTVMDRGIVDQLGVQVVPTFIIVRPDLTIAGSHSGKLTAEKFRVFLIKHRFD